MKKFILVFSFFFVLNNGIIAQCQPPSSVASSPNMIYYAGGSCMFYDSLCNLLLSVPAVEASWSCSPATAKWVVVSPSNGGYYEFPNYSNNNPQINFDQYMRPFWSADTIYNELIFLNGAGTSAKLMFTPTQILSVKNYNQTITYTQGTDYTLNGNTLTQLNPAMSSSVSLTVGSGLQNKQHTSWINVTYKPSRSDWSISNNFTYRGSQLPKTMAKLNSGQPVKMQAIGMSITAGLNVSGFAGDPNNFTPTFPYMHSYIDMLGQRLNQVFPGPITIYNSSCGGKMAAWVDTYCPALVNPNNPDLVFIDMGMNDIWGTSAVAFKNSIQSAMNKMKQHNPNVEFVLIGNMLPDVSGMGAPANGAVDMYGFRTQYLNMDTVGVVFFDMTSISDSIYDRKGAYQCTANSLHPNDYLARWYAQGLFQMFNNTNVSGIPGTLNLDAVTCFPNPSEGVLMVDLGFSPTAPVDVTVFNLLGQVVYEGKQFQQKQQFDFSRLPKGNYNMQLGKSSKKQQVSFIIK